MYRPPNNQTFNHHPKHKHIAYTVEWLPREESENGLGLVGYSRGYHRNHNKILFRVEAQGGPQGVELVLKTEAFLEAPEIGNVWDVEINRTIWSLERDGDGNNWRRHITFAEWLWLVDPVYADEISAEEIAQKLQVNAEWLYSESDISVSRIMSEAGLRWIVRSKATRFPRRLLSVQDADRLIYGIRNARPHLWDQQQYVYSEPRTGLEQLDMLTSRLASLATEIPELPIDLVFQARHVMQRYRAETTSGEAPPQPERPVFEPWDYVTSNDRFFHNFSPPDAISWLGGRGEGDSTMVVVERPDDFRIKLWVLPDRWDSLPDALILGSLVIEKSRFSTSNQHLYQADIEPSELSVVLNR